MFVLSNLRHTYNGEEVLRIGSWSVGQGEHWLVLGPSGSGKTTLLHILAGILTPTSGQVCVAGQDLQQLRAGDLDRFRGRHIGLVFQRLHLVPSLTLLQNLSIAQYLAGRQQSRKDALDLLHGLGLADKADRRPQELSFGQLQRAAVARAVVNAPLLILADEPTSNLDERNALDALELLLGEAKICQATLVIATHDRRIRTHFQHELSLKRPA
jgi:putative ABC transport system ATP-binding protein